MRSGISFTVSFRDRQRLQAIVAWTTDPDKIIAARNRGFQTFESIH